ncbi:pimeloyl-ACP methyl ester carboxylesterase [Methanocalculus alkaliphilus]|uniref:alpha/beta fold hydrolase n=1 Tax=Methanocalculus alkaliphilus TaxID=768730 RepID=UPI0020A1C763|nr:alpha/beta hydrolase [Methanocalculus alkaliphilus]MCP1716337.1 pimeloyl-ACP methyl ester carboxylesterase [Methanocalculus alkaliphilus]
MDRRSIFTLTLLFFALTLLATAGCIATSDTTQPAQQETRQLPVISFDETPIQYADVNDVTLAYQEFGSGEPLLLIEGFGATMGGWNETFISILASEYHVYIYDHRGMGQSSAYTTPPSIYQFSDDAAALMTVLGYDSMHVYGVSMGSTTSQQLTIDHPEKVRKLILDSSTYSIRIPETKTLLGLIESTAIDPATPEGVRQEAEANLAWNGSFGGLSGIEKDVMLLVGTDDVLTPDAVSVEIAGEIDGSWLVRFKGIPHAGFHYAPVEYGESVLFFLAMDEFHQI